MITFLDNLLNIYLETALWLLLGLSLAAVIKGWIPEALVKRLLSGNGPGSVIRAALIGAPLPLCSCGVLPTAVGLHRSGASKPATTAFLIATPETGVDSITVTYALMGPVMAVIRPLAAITSAIVSGLMVLFFDRPTAEEPASQPDAVKSCCSSNQADPVQKQAVTSSCASASTTPQPEVTDSCCSPNTTQKRATDTKTAGCCASNDTTSQTTPGIWSGMRFALVDILDDIKYWMAFGLVLAALIASVIEPGNLAAYGSGLGAMLLMLVVGLPLYICASASTPLAAALLLAGLSPGTVLVFLLVGPATNIASLGILLRELGKRALILYLSGISVSAIVIGLLVDGLLGEHAIQLAEGITHHQNGDTYSLLHWAAAFVLLMLTIKPLRSRFGF
ncbi:SO_0444 family Cu/Zn efflux transporter [Pontibacterium granulatum]|uniref:SO_0444 family Cu/Zn efflux transporter n=1 Tax=Pontibacterium granulatum TaxID=2036029 RepID=UPI00249BBB32|nr:SO_0444 family Cu/Zn efflux transporter [Pontibacterium granulatum]MDI3323813.1 SO_0444 family Cu/Zn efflux transporter [Pontibacterium granulatum]